MGQRGVRVEDSIEWMDNEFSSKVFKFNKNTRIATWISFLAIFLIMGCFLWTYTGDWFWIIFGIIKVITLGFVHSSLSYKMVIWKCIKFSTYEQEMKKKKETE